MDPLREFGQILSKKFDKSKVQVAWAIVKEVNWDDHTMTAIGVSDGLEYFDVLLGLGSIYLKPKIDARCLIGMIENKDAATYLIEAEELEEIEYVVGNSKFTIKEDGYKIIQSNESLKDVLNDLISEVSKIIVVTGTTINVHAMTKIKQRLNKILIA